MEKSAVRKRVQAHYSGRVQGVGFRYTVCGIARGFEVKGYVRNLPGGVVEVVAEGEGAELERFLEAIAASELAEFIRNATKAWSPSRDEFRDFGVQF